MENLNFQNLNLNEENNLVEEISMSDYPEESANWYWDDEWIESEAICIKCKNFRMWQAGWYDGTPDNCGACIGTKYECGNCGHYERD